MQPAYRDGIDQLRTLPHPDAIVRWHLAERLKVPPMKVEKRIIQTLTDDQMQMLLSVRPKRLDHWRLRTLVCLLLDCGLRIEEALTLRRSDVDFRCCSATTR